MYVISIKYDKPMSKFIYIYISKINVKIIIVSEFISFIDRDENRIIYIRDAEIVLKLVDI